MTGGTGFVGSHLVERLLEDGWQVRCLVRPTSRLRWLPAERVEVFVRDPGGEPPREAMEGVDRVFHLAAVTAAAGEATYRRANVDATAALVRSVAERAPDARLVFCSSQAAAGPSPAGRPVTERDPPSPIGWYGASKLAAERLIAASGVPHVIVRPPTVYGPRDRDVLMVFRLAARGFALRIAPADQAVSLVHVRDLTEAFVLAAERGANGGVYYVTDGASHTWRGLVDAIAAAVGRRPRVLPVPRVLAHGVALSTTLAAHVLGLRPPLTPERIRTLAQLSWACDDGRARAELGWSARTDFPSGAEDTARWYRDQGWL